MFEQYSYKVKLIALGLIAVILFLASYKRSFKLTIASYDQMKQSENRLREIDERTFNAQNLIKNMTSYNLNQHQNEITPEEVQRKILEFVSDYDQVTIDHLNQTHEFNDGHLITYTNQLRLSGTYNNLLELVYSFERNLTASTVVSVDFEKVKDYKKNRENLKVNLIFQNYEKIN